MSDLTARINEINAIVKNPKKQMQKYLDAGKKVVGCFPMYTPEEIVHAGGMIPFGLWGAQTELFLAKTYLPAFACPIMQSNLELGLRGTYKGVSAVIIPTMCDTFRCISQDWKAGVDIPMIAFTFPQNRVMAASLAFLSSEYEHVKGQLETICGVKISEAAIEDSIHIYNEHNQIMREFAALANDHLDVVTPNVRHNIMKSSFFVEKAEHTRMMMDIIAGLKALPVHKWTGKKVVLTGITAEPQSFLALFEQNNIAVVGDDLGQEMRQFRTDVPEEGANALDRLARQWQNRTGCPLAHSEKKTRGELLLDLCQKGKADGVVVCMMKFCDPEEYDFPIYNRQLKAAGIPVVQIEMDQQTVNNEQARTKIQTFADML